MTQPASPFRHIRAVLFDLDGTLRQVTPTSQEAILSYVYELGYEVNEGGRRDAILWSHTFWAQSRHPPHQPAEDVATFWQTYIQHFMEKLSPRKVTVEEASSAVFERFMRLFKPKRELVKGAKELLWALRSNRVVVGVVCNRQTPITGEAIELGIIEHLNFTLAAGQVDSWKPDAALFEAALMMAGEAAADTLYVGNNYYTDVVGSRQAGLTPVLIDEHQVYGHMSDECVLIPKLLDLTNHIQFDGEES
jgi:FMN phosphatase YigB (HAD superfamily)